MPQGTEGTSELDPRRFALRSERAGGDQRVRVLGEMDLSVIGSVDREVARAEAGDAARIVLDLEELEFLDASGIRLLLNLNARSKSNGDRLRITKARFPQVQRIIDLTGVGDLLPFLD
jgi:stage II sporulation protein AA (anti-sigma F factor antagonist)